MTSASRLIDVFTDAGVACDEDDILDEAIRELDGRLAGRLRVVATAACDTPPDLDGLCIACGRKIAPAVKHEPGCNPFALVIVPIARLRRVAIRTYRLGRLMWVAARYRRLARGIRRPAQHDPPPDPKPQDPPDKGGKR